MPVVNDAVPFRTVVTNQSRTGTQPRQPAAPAVPRSARRRLSRRAVGAPVGGARGRRDVSSYGYATYVATYYCNYTVTT